MKTTRTDLAALVIVALAVTAITLLTLQHAPVPEILSTVALVALGIGGGIAIPSRGTATEAAAAVATEAAAVLAAPAPVIPAQAAVAVESPLATHAP